MELSSEKANSFSENESLTTSRKRTGTSLTESDDAPISKSSKTCEPFRLNTMQLVKVLRSDVQSRRIILHTKLKDDPLKDAIVILQKSTFPRDENSLKQNGFCSIDQEKNGEEDSPSNASWKLNEVLQNDVYHRFEANVNSEAVNRMDLTVIHPAEEQHFRKFASGGKTIYHETPEVYKDIIIPFLAKKPRDLLWIENIFEGKAEVDRVLFSDPDMFEGFTLVLDYTWNGRYLEDMHCLGLIRNPELTCLRDLRTCHLPMLKKILGSGKKYLSEKYANGIDNGSSQSESGDVEENSKSTTVTTNSLGLREEQIMAFFHYPPTFYRLHVHFKHVDAGLDAGTQVGRAHMLDEVIRNLELDGDYYAKRTMSIHLHNSGMYRSAIFPKIDGTPIKEKVKLDIEA